VEYCCMVEKILIPIMYVVCMYLCMYDTIVYDDE
jgi:hypothetical protein